VYCDNHDSRIQHHPPFSIQATTYHAQLLPHASDGSIATRFHHFRPPRRIVLGVVRDNEGRHFGSIARQWQRISTLPSTGSMMHKGSIVWWRIHTDDTYSQCIRLGYEASEFNNADARHVHSDSSILL
jgi:hypothetical protein